MSEKFSSPQDLEGKHQQDGTVTPMSRVTTVTSATDLFEDGTVDPVYQAKARVLNAAIQEIGMGKYQVRRLWFGSKSVKLMSVGI